MPIEKPTTLSDVVKPITAVAPKDGTTEPAATPDAYQGKSMEEVIAIAEQNAKNHAEAQKTIGRQGTELGEVRRMADQLIQADLGTRTPAGDTTVTNDDVDLDSFEDPKAATKAITQLIDRKVAERLSTVEGDVSKLTGYSVEQRLNDNHPDWRSVILSQEYSDWVSASPVRIRLAQAGNAGDYDSGNELLTNFAALHPKAPTTTDGDAGDPAADKDAALKAAELETGASHAGRGAAKKPVYRRADLLELRMKDPDRYDSMRAEIRQAFAEGRVK